MASNDLRLQVILQTFDQATAPLRRISAASQDSAKALKATRDKLKELNEQQKAVGQFREVRTGLTATATSMQTAQARVQQLAQQMAATATPTKAMAREFNAAKRQAAALGTEFQQQQQKAQQLRDRLTAAGISTSALGGHEKRLRADIKATNQSITDQTAQLKAQGAQQKRLAEIKAQHGKAMMHTAMIGGGGAAAMGAGRAIARPLGAVMGAYMPQEDSQAQLKASMMRKDGSVPEEFQKITDLATKLGDKLPGTTADFQNMMTMLIRQGMSAKTILGGLGESAAFLGVQLKMPVTEAAEFAAKMQDATRTTEGDMMGLMDVIQRTFYLGVDSDNMLQGFTKMSPVLGILGKDGLEASKALAPLLVMMDQTGMKGESAGNAIRKVFQGGLDAKKLGKANDALQGMQAGFKLDFTDGKGEFGGIDQMFAQLDQLKSLSSVDRTSVVKTLFGDDAETLQVLNTLMAKGKDGYMEVIQKMEAQADLRKRVDAELGTLTNVMEAAQGSFTNALAEIGATVAPTLKTLLTWLGGLAGAAGAWARQNPVLTSTLFKIVAVVGGLVAGAGALAMTFAAITGPMMLMRFGMQMIGMNAGMVIGALKAVASVIMLVGRALLMNPLGVAISLLAAAAFLLYRNWEGVKGGLLAIWQSLGGSFTAALATIASAIVNWSPLGLFYRAFAGVLGWMGLELPATFSSFGSQMIQGLVNGITNSLGAVKDAITGAAGAAVGWFKEKLGIASPSKVFMLAGNEISNGAAEGIAEQQSGVRKAAVGMAAAAAAALPLMAGAGAGLGAEVGTEGAPLMDARPPLTAPAAQAQPAAVGGDTINITIQAAAGMDPQAIARAVSAELDKRQRGKRASMMSSLSDID